LKQIQFLSHQAKICSKVELYTFVPSGNQALSAQIPLNEIHFNRLGYLSLDANERSTYQARELKSVYVDSVTLLLKVVFNKCHLNKFNLHNQVGIIALNSMGEIYNNPATSGQIEKVPVGLFEGDNRDGGLNAEELSLDKATLETLKALYSAKDRAVQNEDFDEAKRLKETVERLKQVATHISQLEERKLHAIQSEDYEAAKLIKSEIEQLKQQCMYPSF